MYGWRSLLFTLIRNGLWKCKGVEQTWGVGSGYTFLGKLEVCREWQGESTTEWETGERTR